MMHSSTYHWTDSEKLYEDSTSEIGSDGSESDPFLSDLLACIKHSIADSEPNDNDILEPPYLNCDRYMEKHRPETTQLRHSSVIVPTTDRNTGEMYVEVAGYQYSIDPTISMDTVGDLVMTRNQTSALETAPNPGQYPSTPMTQNTVFSSDNEPPSSPQSVRSSSLSSSSPLSDSHDDPWSSYTGNVIETAGHESHSASENIEHFYTAMQTHTSPMTSSSSGTFEYGYQDSVSSGSPLHRSSAHMGNQSDDSRLYNNYGQNTEECQQAAMFSSSRLPTVSSAHEIPTTSAFPSSVAYQPYIWPVHTDTVYHTVGPSSIVHGSSKKRKPSRRLWEFIRDLLLSPDTNPSLIKWEDRGEGTFKLVQSKAIAHMWGMKKGNEAMTYEKLSRAMRYYYKRQVFQPVIGKRLVYRFGPKATGWKEDP